MPATSTHASLIEEMNPTTLSVSCTRKSTSITQSIFREKNRSVALPDPVHLSPKTNPDKNLVTFEHHY